jgi:hypothetical protein
MLEVLRLLRPVLVQVERHDRDLGISSEGRRPVFSVMARAWMSRWRSGTSSASNRSCSASSIRCAPSWRGSSCDVTSRHVRQRGRRRQRRRQRQRQRQRQRLGRRQRPVTVACVLHSARFADANNSCGKPVDGLGAPSGGAPAVGMARRCGGAACSGPPRRARDLAASRKREAGHVRRDSAGSDRDCVPFPSFASRTGARRAGAGRARIGRTREAQSPAGHDPRGAARKAGQDVRPKAATAR